MKVVKPRVMVLVTLLQNQMISIGIDNPESIFISLPLLVALFYIYRKAGKNFGIVASRLGIASRYRVFVKALNVIKIATFVVLIFAALHPYTIRVVEIPISIDNVLEVNTTAIDIVVLFDISKSMGYREISSTRFDIALSILSQFLNIVRKDHVILVVFSKEPRILCKDATEDTDRCLSMLRNIELEKYSAIGNAVAYGISYAKASSKPIALVLITDGARNYGMPIDDAVSIAKASSIPITVVLIGSDSRARELVDVCKNSSIDIYRVDRDLQKDVLEDMVKDLYREVRYLALKSSGYAYAYTYSKDYTLSKALIIAALVLFLISIIEGI